jgi:hypothetical protein
MNYDNKINGSLKRIEIYIKQAINNIFTNDLKVEIGHYNTLHKQIDRECDIIIQICSHLVGLIDSNYGKEIITHIRDNGDME